MAPVKFRILAFLVVFFAGSGQIKADHFMGGELTWTCLGSGSYKFHMVLYRDCSFPSSIGTGSILIQNNIVGGPSINLTLYAQNDISPNGFYANGDSSCWNCMQGTITSGNVASTIERYYFESNPISIPGIPPPGGWVFWYETCCINTTVTNVNYAGLIGFLRIESRMFASGNQVAGICDDSSPDFVEVPSFMACIGVDNELQHLSIDPDDDFLVYEYTSAITELGDTVPMTAGYSIAQPLPGVFQNPLNITTDINMYNGEVLFNSYTTGRFLINVKVSSYRDAIKISEITRCHPVIVTANCPPISGSTANFEPVLDAPFFDTTSNSFTLYEDTVFAGDVVNFSSAALEFDIFENGDYQECIFSVAGSQFGTNFNSSTTGCLQPPCATIDIAVPDTFLFAQTFVFNWQTTTSHLNTFGWNPAKTYYFLFRATDNYCPVNGSKARIVSITVVDSTVGIESLNTQVQLKIFPNPAKDGVYYINFKNLDDENFPVTIANISGQTISHQHFYYLKEESKGILDLSSQPSGIYILRIGDSVSRIVKL